MVSGLAVAAFAGVGLVVVAPAHAAELPAIKTVEITKPANMAVVGQSVELRATWEVADARADDTFRLGLPSAFDGIPTTFDLKDQSESVLGTCAVTKAEIVCTLSDQVENFAKVTGDLYFWSAVVEENTTGTVVFETEGNVIVVDLPGGGIGSKPNHTFPTETTKSGTMLQDGSDLIHWAITIPGSVMLESGQKPFLVRDEHDESLTIRPSSIRIYYLSKTQWEQSVDRWGDNQHLQPTSFTVSDVTSGGFTVGIHPPEIRADYVYIIQYETIQPENAQDGDIFFNKATGYGLDTMVGAVYQSAGGGAEGSNEPRSISLTKQVEGPAPEGAEYIFSLACIDLTGTVLPGFPKELSIAAGETSVVESIPVSSRCELTETDGKGAEVAFDREGPISVSRNSPAEITMTATNTFAPEPEPEPTVDPEPAPVDPEELVDPDPRPAPAGVPTTDPTTPVPMAGGSATVAPSPVLAHTGAQIAGVVGAALVLLLVGTAIVLARRKATV